MGTAVQLHEFSRKFVLADVPATGRDLTMEATPEERAALARRLGLPAVHGLSAKLRVTPRSDGAVVDGRFEADLRQICVVSLEPFDVHLSGQIHQSYIYAADDTAPSGSLTDPWSEDLPEPLRDGATDLGDLVVQYLALAIDPYPRSSNAGADALPQKGSSRDSPFAVLKALKGGKP